MLEIFERNPIKNIFRNLRSFLDENIPGQFFSNPGGGGSSIMTRNPNFQARTDGATGTIKCIECNIYAELCGKITRSFIRTGTSEEPVGNTRTGRHHKSKTYLTKWK